MVLAILGAIALIVHVWHLGHFGSSLALLKDHLNDIRWVYGQHPFFVLLAWCLVAILMYTLAIPGAGVLDMGAGAVFGLVPGLAVMLVAGTVGSISAFLAGRYLFRDWAERRFGDRSERVRTGFERHGNLYLLSLRFIPFMPHFVLNFGVALTRMRLRDFVWMTFIGNIPITWALVNAGTAIVKIQSLDDVMTPKTITALFGLGAIPLLAVIFWVILGRFNRSPESPSSQTNQ